MFPPNTSPKNPVSGVVDWLKNLLNPQPYDPYAQSVQPALPASYQVKAGDTFKTIAKQNGLAETQLQKNNNMLIVPPKGSYISLNPQTEPTSYNTAMRGRGYQVGANPSSTALPFAAPYPQTAPTGEGRGDPAMQNLRNQAKAIQTAPVPPDTIPGVVMPLLTINGVPATPELMVANGYVYNQATAMWVKKGSSAAANVHQTGNNWETNPSLHTFIWRRNAKNRQSRFTTNLKWARAQWKRERQRRYGERASGTNLVRQAAPAEPTVAGTTPQTVLDLHLGSG